jgi:serine phosphatase RsbU (regulator of sigma subunit)
MYTDGLVEAFSERAENHKEYGVDGVIDTLLRMKTDSLEKTLKGLFDDSFGFTGGAGRHDDTSVVLMERE